MKITLPHMGNMSIAAKGMLEYLDLDVVLPPHSNQRALNFGVKHAPEFSCLPFKIILGNLMEASELGANTFIMSGGVGPCRFGLFPNALKDILEKQGYQYENLTLELPDKHIGEFLKRLKKITGNRPWLEVYKAAKFGYEKMIAIDLIEKHVQYLRPRESIHGTVDKMYEQALKNIDNAATFTSLEEITSLTLEKLHNTPLDKDKQIIKIGFIGEIYTLLEPFINLDIEKELGRMGVELRRSLYLSEWVNSHLLKGVDKNNKVRPFAKLAKPYLNYFVGGHGIETIGYAVDFSKDGYDGLIQMAPLTCMPEIVAHSILPSLKKDTDIPILTLYMDEQSGRAGFITRLEAFTDLIHRKKYRERGNENGRLSGY